jgi:hypothetical protein
MVSVAAPSTLNTLNRRWASGARSRCATHGFADARDSFRAPGRFGEAGAFQIGSAHAARRNSARYDLPCFTNGSAARSVT